MSRPYREVFEKQQNGNKDLLAFVFSAREGEPATQNRVQIVENAIELRDALKECLDALHNETFGRNDTPWITCVKKRCADVLARVETVPEPLKSTDRDRVLSSLNAIERHCKFIQKQAYTDQTAAPLAYVLSELRVLRDDLNK